MSFWPVYLGGRFLWRLADFFRHWYLDGSRRLAHGFISFLFDMDRIFAVRITMHYFWKPLYGDYSIIGRVLGVVFRTARIIVALGLYAIFAAIFAVIYLAWLAVPFVPLLMVYRNLFAP